MVWPTRPRDGAPATFDLTPEIWQTYLAPVGVGWAAPLISLMQEETIVVADLCAGPPPEQERWTTNDIVAGLMPGQQEWVTEKLRRMAKAAVWNTYCETYPPPGPLDELEGNPYVLEDSTFPLAQGMLHRGCPIEPPYPDGILEGRPIRPDAEFFIITQMTLEAHVGPGITPRLIIHEEDHTETLWPSNWDDPTFTGQVGAKSFHVLPNSPHVMENAHPHHFAVVTGTGGKWHWMITAWRFQGPAYGPWPMAPPAPNDQFPPECVDALCVMASDHLVATERAIDTGERVLWIADQTPSLRFEYGTSQPVTGSGTMALNPADGYMVQLTTIPDYLGRSSGNPPTHFDAGWFGYGALDGMMRKERLTHAMQLFYPAGFEAHTVSWELAQGVEATIVCLLRETYPGAPDRLPYVPP